MHSTRWTTNEGAQAGDILLALDWIDKEGDPSVVILDLGTEAGERRYVAKSHGGAVLACGADLPALQTHVEAMIPAHLSSDEMQADGVESLIPAAALARAKLVVEGLRTLRKCGMPTTFNASLASSDAGSRNEWCVKAVGLLAGLAIEEFDKPSWQAAIAAARGSQDSAGLLWPSAEMLGEGDVQRLAPVFAVAHQLCEIVSWQSAELARLAPAN